MKIGFWGLGSIAKRHIRNLSSILREREVSYEIDVYRHSDKRYIEEDDIRNIVSHVYSENEIDNHMYDVVFITNPTSLHYDAIQKCASHTKHMFIEKPIVNDWEIDVDALGLREDGIYYVACPLRYTAVLQYVKEHIDLTKVRSVRVISSSYLPNWRPGTDYRNTYSAHRELGGGVAIDLIHEWDYLTALFGFPEQTLKVIRKVSTLELDSDDLATYLGIYPDKVVELHLDYFGRKTIREMLLLTDENTIRADIANSKVVYENQDYSIDLSEDRDMYQKREIYHFLDMIDGKCENDNSIENALKVLKITKEDKE